MFELALGKKYILPYEYFQDGVKLQATNYDQKSFLKNCPPDKNSDLRSNV